jgi:Spy/CpxP family protein refolding chaperone
MRKKTVVICALIALAGRWASAQQPDDQLRGSLFPPQVVMQNQQTLGLTDDQKAYFEAEIRQVQPRFEELQWKVEGEIEKMVSLVKQPKVDEAQALAQLEKVLGLEREIKRAQISLLIRIKNKLTVEQQARLREIQSKPGVK